MSRVQHRARIRGSQVRRGTPHTWYNAHTPEARGILNIPKIQIQERLLFLLDMLRQKAHPHVLFVIYFILFRVG